MDSHAHLDLDEFDKDREQSVERAWEAGLAAILCPADLTVENSLAKTLGLAARYPALRAAAGIHPHQAVHFRADHLAELKRLAAAGKILALGEVGLDFHYNFSPAESQRAAFRAQAAAARETGLPLIIHTRRAGQEAADIVEQENPGGRGVMHCYTEDWGLAQRMLDLGYFISFSGILTFPKAEPLREVALRIPLDRLLVETDSPYLVPVPFRGKIKRNEPRYVIEVAKTLATLKGISLEKLAEATTANFFKLFS
ncbi:MAG TPA: TatD family hydrolase [Acidobacteriota bacterium]